MRDRHRIGRLDFVEARGLLKSGHVDTGKGPLGSKGLDFIAELLHLDVALLAFCGDSGDADKVFEKLRTSLLLEEERKLDGTVEEVKQGYVQVKQLRDEVQAFATKWPLPGVDVSTLQKPTGLHEI